MRGNAKQIQPTAGYQGITPAYAGKRWFHEEFQPSPWDHPRICGEKQAAVIRMTTPKGSPPHMRGKGRPVAIQTRTTGITPAYAGKSYTVVNKAGILGDHPRVCGEKLNLTNGGVTV